MPCSVPKANKAERGVMPWNGQKKVKNCRNLSKLLRN